MQDDFDIFSNVNSFLNGDLPTPQNAPPQANESVASIELDNYIEAVTSKKIKKKLRRLSTSNSSTLSVSPEKKFVPQKGQKMAMKRLEALNQKTLEKPMSPPKMPKKSQPPKRNNTVADLGEPTRRKSRRISARIHTNFNIIEQEILDSDEEQAIFPQGARSSSTAVQNVSIDDLDSENYQVALKLQWMNQMRSMTLRKHQKFIDLMDILANEEKAERSKIVLTMDDRIIRASDTPDSIGYSLGKFIRGRIMKTTITTTKSTRTETNTNSIELKIQSQLWKQPILLSIGKTDKMKVLVIKLAEELKCQPSSIKLRFDGDILNLGLKPIELDLEGGEVLDLVKI